MFSVNFGNNWSWALLLTLLCAAPAQAQEVTVKNAWVRGMVQGQSATGAYMELTAKSAARLVSVASPVAKTAEVHNMKMENGVMRMFPVAGIEIAAGQTVKFASGGYHVMLMGLKNPLHAGDKVELTLSFELADKKTEAVTLSVDVRDLKGQSALPHHKH